MSSSEGTAILVTAVAAMALLVGFAMFMTAKESNQKHEKEMVLLAQGEPSTVTVEPLADAGEAVTTSFVPTGESEPFDDPEPVQVPPHVDKIDDPLKRALSIAQIEMDIERYYNQEMPQPEFVDQQELSLGDRGHFMNVDYILLVGGSQLVGLKFSGEATTDEQNALVDELIALYGEYPAVFNYAGKTHSIVSTPLLDHLRERIDSARKALRQSGIRLKMWNSGVSKETLDTVLERRPK